MRKVYKYFLNPVFGCYPCLRYPRNYHNYDRVVLYFNKDSQEFYVYRKKYKNRFNLQENITDYGKITFPNFNKDLVEMTRILSEYSYYILSIYEKFI